MNSQDPMESFRAAVDHADRNPSKVVSYAWYLVLVSTGGPDFRDGLILFAGIPLQSDVT